MKKIEGINEPVQLVIATEKDKEVKGPTMKNVILVELSLARPGTDKMRLFKIGMDLMNAKDSIELEDADFKIIKDLLTSDKCGHPDFMVGGILAKMEEAKKE